MQGMLELTFPAEPASVAEARAKVCDALEPHLPDGASQTLRLLVSEVVTNAVKHGDGGGPVEVHAHWNGEVRIEVCDHGEGFTPSPRLGPVDEPGGFGLYLVGQLADRWGVETDDGTTVWFVLRRR
jgi:anti-sigma regulatory factor (Ser/Thr protein kinase)